MKSARLKKWLHTIHVIHLSNATARKITFCSLNKNVGVRFEMVEGVNTNDLDLRQIERQNLIRPHTTFRTPGCALSHRNLWLRASETQMPLIACEDDAVVRMDFLKQFSNCITSLPADWDLILLGYNFDSFLDAEIIPGVERLSGEFTNKSLTISRLKKFQASTLPVSVMPLRQAFGTPGYAVSPSGAKFLLDHVFPLRNLPVSLFFQKRTLASHSMDGIMNRFYCKMKAYVCLPPLVVSPNIKNPNARIVRVS